MCTDLDATISHAIQFRVANSRRAEIKIMPACELYYCFKLPDNLSPCQLPVQTCTSHGVNQTVQAKTEECTIAGPSFVYGPATTLTGREKEKLQNLIGDKIQDHPLYICRINKTADTHNELNFSKAYTKDFLSKVCWHSFTHHNPEESVF